MRRLIPIFSLLAAALWSLPVFAQSRAQLGPLCTSEGTPADQQIDACNKIIALKVFSGDKLATVYFWRAVGWNKKGNYVQVIADTSEAIRLKPDQALYNMRAAPPISTKANSISPSCALGLFDQCQLFDQSKSDAELAPWLDRLAEQTEAVDAHSP
jgi:hypothetical protein